MSIVPDRLAAALADRYRIEREIGAGGMATVYLAEDLKHRRRVALKVLRPELGAVLGPERFLSEINVTANLQHPHLLPLFDSGEVDGVLFYVMPYIDGESLRARLERERQLPIDEAVRIATSILSALDYAHRHGVIHRDLKPENILLHDGQPLIADFGIALAVSNAGGARVTQTGLSLGTPQYMSPEQVTGDRVIDGRSDIYALAAVLYEMLVGDPPHAAGTTQAIIAKVLTEQPPSVRTCRSTVPPHVDAAVMHALNKLPADRFDAAADFGEALAGTRAVPHLAGGVQDAARERRSARAVAPIIAVAIVALLAGAGASAVWRGPAPNVESPVVRAFMPSPRKLSADRPLSVSPDGRAVAYGMPGEHPDGGIWVRDGGALQPRQIARHGRSPVFSKDGRWLAYLDGGRVMRVPVAGGTPQLVTSIYFPVGLDWTDDGRLIVVRPPHSVIVIDTATAAIDTIFRDTAGVRWPVLLPGGRELLYTTNISTDSVELRLGDIATGSSHQILRPALQARYVSTGHLVFARPDSALYAVPFDLRRRAVTGAPVRVLDRVATGPQSGTLFDVSRNGVAAYLVDSVPSIALFHVRDGGSGEQLRVTAGVVEGLRVSPEAARLAFARDGAVRVFDLRLGTTHRIEGERTLRYPVWFADGDSLAMEEGSDIGRHLRIAAADGSREPHVLSKDYHATPQAVFRDGRILASRGPNGNTAWDIVTVRITGDSLTGTDWLNAEWSEIRPALSPDERWVAFVSAETSPPEVWVRPFADAAAGKWQISRGGGIDPVWSRDGSTLYYWEGPAMRAARVRTEPYFEVLERRTVLNDPLYAAGCCFANYDVLPDGSMIVARHVVTPPAPGFILVSNWFSEMRARIAAAEGGAR